MRIFATAVAAALAFAGPACADPCLTTDDCPANLTHKPDQDDAYGRQNVAATLALAETGSGGARRKTSGFQVTPYVWGASFGGKIQPLPNTPEFQISRPFHDLLEDMDAAAFVSGYARVGKFVAMGDLSHNSASRKGFVSTPLPQAPIVPAEAHLKLTSMTLTAGVRAVDFPSISIDLLAGLRTFWIRTSVESAPLGIARSPAVNLVDPVAAVRLNGRLADGWSVIAYGDFGGFGVGSEFTAQAAATLNARVAQWLWISAGYRYLMVDYRGELTRADLHLSGPLLGATFTF